MITPPRTSKSKELAQVVGKWIEDRYATPVKVRLAPRLDHRDISNNMEIYVFPEGRDVELLNRDGDCKVDYGIGITITERIQPDCDEDIRADDLIMLCESIGQHLVRQQVLPSTFGDVAVGGHTHAPVYDREWLEKYRCFGGGIVIELSRIETSETDHE